MTELLTLFILLDTAHVLSPIILSCGHSGLRGLIFDRQRVLAMCAVFLMGIIGGVIAWPYMLEIYLIWNFWHFSMQNFGVLQMVKSARHVNLPLAFVLTTLGFWFAPLATGVNHWVTDIGLSSRVMGRWWPAFLAVLAIASPTGFLWDRAPWLWPQLTNPTLIERTGTMANVLIAFRLALGLYHFEISRSIWKLSDPRVLATIGKELLA